MSSSPSVTDRPPGAVLGQSGAAVLRHAAAGDVPTGGDVQPPPNGVQTHVGDCRAGTERPGNNAHHWRVVGMGGVALSRFLRDPAASQTV